MRILPVSPPPSDFPSDVLKWMKKNNAAPKSALKLMQICKYFQHHEFPYLVMRTLQGGGWGYNNEWRYWPLKVAASQDLNKIEQPLWITEGLRLFENTPPLWFWFPKIAVCDINLLHLHGYSITMEQLKKLTAAGKIKVFALKNCFIKDENGKAVPLEDIFECLTSITYFKIIGNSNSFASYQKATETIPPDLTMFTLHNMHENYNVEECFKFIQNNQKIGFQFREHLQRSEDHNKKLQHLTDNLIKAWQPTHQPPDIHFIAQTKESKDKFYQLFEIYFHEQRYQ